MPCRRLMSLLLARAVPRSFRTVLPLLWLRRCPEKALWNATFPRPVILIRLARPLCDFSFGIASSSSVLVPRQAGRVGADLRFRKRRAGYCTDTSAGIKAGCRGPSGDQAMTRAGRPRALVGPPGQGYHGTRPSGDGVAPWPARTSVIFAAVLAVEVNVQAAGLFSHPRSPARQVVVRSGFFGSVGLGARATHRRPRVRARGRRESQVCDHAASTRSLTLRSGSGAVALCRRRLGRPGGALPPRPMPPRCDSRRAQADDPLPKDPRR